VLKLTPALPPQRFIYRFRSRLDAAQVRYRVVESSGELAGLTGRGASRSTHADYPYLPLTLEYELT